jgi:serine phosphatase RsbU (regulator of sigma subunit)
MDDARILVRLFGPSPPPLQKKFSDGFFRGLSGKHAGWMIHSLDGTNKELIGYAPLSMNFGASHDVQVEGVRPMYVLTHDAFEHVMAPVFKLSYLLGSIGAVVVICFGIIGLYIASRKIIDPLETLKNAARCVSASARLTGIQANSPSKNASADTMLTRVDNINTGDEIESLAGDFSLMARRVMNYHVQLEDELARKTMAIQEDLAMAREFQESLLPTEYPKVSDWNQNFNMALEFFHVYKPTLSVGGDFFHVEKLSDHSASIFIADVTGHGARAALVTAILRTLVRDLAGRAENPAAFLDQMNSQFYSMMPRHLDCIFATAFYLVLDMKNRKAKFASAGHPYALLVDRTNCCVSPIVQNSDCGPALGLMETATYRSIERPLHHRDAFLMFTDGLIEAANPAGAEFGWDRLMACASQHYQRPISHQIMKLLDEANQFMNTEMAVDDICVVAVEAHDIKSLKPIS